MRSKFDIPLDLKRIEEILKELKMLHPSPEMSKFIRMQNNELGRLPTMVDFRKQMVSQLPYHPDAVVLTMFYWGLLVGIISATEDKQYEVN